MSIPNNLMILLLIILACSCSKNQSCERRTIDLAEQLMNERPDSALYLLENSVNADSLSRENYALWCLLVTQARDKTYATDTSDAAIRVAIDYYSEHSDSRRLSLAYYEAGRIAHEGGRARDAQKYYHQALDAGQNVSDYDLLGHTASHLGDLYIFQGLHDEALHYLKQSENYSRQTADTANLALELRDIGRAYSSMNQNDSSIVYYTEALTYATSEDSAHIMNELGGVYAESGKLDTALVYAKKALNCSIEEGEKKHILLVLGKIYKNKGARDSAKYYLKKITESADSTSMSGPYFYLYKIAGEEQQWEEYAAYHKKYEILEDSIQKQTHTETELKIEKLYNYDKMANEATLYRLYHVENQRNLFALASLALVLLFSLARTFTYFKAKEKKRKSEIEKIINQHKQRKFEVSDEQVKENLERIEKIDELIKQTCSEALNIEKMMLKDNNKWILEFLKIRDEKTFVLQETPIYKKLHSTDTAMKHSDFKELTDTVRELFPHLYAHWENLNFNVADIETASLIKLGFNQNRIAKLLDGRTKTSMRILKLAKKLNMEDADKETLFKFIRNL